MQVSLPGLHITLGVFYRLWSLLEKACHQLDMELAKRTAPLSVDRQSFSDYAVIVRDLASLKEEKNELTVYTVNLNSQLVQVGSQLHPDNHPFFYSIAAGGRQSNEEIA